MNVLVVGSGGREHALAWKLAQSNRVERVFCAPGNAGTAADVENVDIDVSDIAGIIDFNRQNKIELTVVGPEQPLCDGLVDALDAEGMRAFGPSKAAAQLEGSKVFCKQILRSADVPTADYQVFRDPQTAEHFVQQRYEETPDDVPLVIKADGLAAGKGVIVCSTLAEVMSAIDQVAREKAFGDAGHQFIIEERLVGREASVLAITDGQTILTLPAAQDHKAAYDGDRGPNTGGMGAYCPTPLVSTDQMRWIEENVLVPTIHAMKRGRSPFRGVLYAGLMLTASGPKVLEYNVRFGDPECQPVLMRLNSDLFEIVMACLDGKLESLGNLQWDPRPSICVVMASEGYPGSYDKGHIISGLEAAAELPDVKIFHAGTKMDGDDVVTSGGRVLGVTALGDTISSAKLQAYRAIKCIRWSGAWCRKDISDKALETEFA